MCCRKLLFIVLFTLVSFVYNLPTFLVSVLVSIMLEITMISLEYTKVSRHIPIICLLPLSMEKCEEGARKLIPSGYVSQGLNALRTHDKALKHLIGNSPVPPKDHCNCSFQIRKYD